MIEYKKQDIDGESESYITLNTKYEKMEKRARRSQRPT